MIGPFGARSANFCSSSIFPINPDGTIRLVTDLAYLNNPVFKTFNFALYS